MYYEFYILQTAPLSSTTRDPSRYSEARDKGRGVGLYSGEMERKATRLRIWEGDLLETFESRKWCCHIDKSICEFLGLILFFILFYPWS